MVPRFPILHPAFAPAYESLFSCVSGFQPRRSCLKVSQDPRFPFIVHCYATLKGRRAGPSPLFSAHPKPTTTQPASCPKNNLQRIPRGTAASSNRPLHLNRFISIFRRSFLWRILFGSDIPPKTFKHNLTTTQEIYAKSSSPVRSFFQSRLARFTMIFNLHHCLRAHKLLF